MQLLYLEINIVLEYDELCRNNLERPKSQTVSEEIIKKSF
jgi:hypothetical protein